MTHTEYMIIWRRNNPEKVKKTVKKYCENNKDKKREYNKRYSKTPMSIYHRQKHRAKERGVEWLFTFEDWWKVWDSSNKWEDRGRSKGKYCMCRFNDEGPYSVENVYIDTTSNNMKLQRKLRKVSL